MSKYDGTKTQKNLEAAFAGESEEISILILHLSLKKRDLSRFRICF